ncbi:MAG TPA: family 2A encapsulin nanocompartment cargo protein cysteine desulfurase [Polyangiaceae bacterium]|nr:family 2A encapsulin nanocompartment cargo protein cysteine desulfurase [Polyangiaceae bacterium]
MSTADGSGPFDPAVLTRIASEMFRSWAEGAPEGAPSLADSSSVVGAAAPGQGVQGHAVPGSSQAVPAQSGLPGASGVPTPSALPGGSSLPGVSGLAGVPGFPGLPGPGIPGSSSFSASPGIPGLPGGVPGPSAIPAIPGIPGGGGIPSGLPSDGGDAGGAAYYFLEFARSLDTTQPASLSSALGPSAPVPSGLRTDPGAFGAHVPHWTSPSAQFDVARVRGDFPILAERVNGRQLVWLDNAATTQKPRVVIERLRYFYEHENSNIHRAAHALAARSTDAYEKARQSVQRFLNADSSERIVFVRGATEAINLVAAGWGETHVGAGDEIVVSHLEHHANIVPWQRLAEKKGAKLRVAPVDDSGQILLGEYAKLLGPRTKIVSFTQVSNALGTVTPAAQMVQMARAVGARVLVDGAQAVSHMPVDVNALGADFYVFSGHKVFGPTGIGALYGTAEALDEMSPWQGGGNMIQDVTFERTVYQPPPHRFEAGTGNIADAVGLGAAIEYVQSLGMDRIAAYEHELLVYGTRLLQQVPGLRLIGTAAEKAGVLSFVVQGHSTADIGQALDKRGIAVRGGHHCAQPILRRFGLESTVRPSLAFYNTHGELEQLTEALCEIVAGSRTSAVVPFGI